VCIDAANCYGFTPLHEAIENNHEESVSLLLEKGANINICVPIFNETPLHWAVQKGSFNIVRIIIEKGADVNAKDRDVVSALEMAIESGRNDIAELLRKHGAKE
jgi:ankyrin repeat protein